MTHGHLIAASVGEALVLLVIVGLGMPLVLMAVVWKMGLADDRLESWARTNGLRLMSKEARYFARGPFAWTTGTFQTVYRITVEDLKGQARSGWARPGGGPLRLWSEQVDVQWDGPPEFRA
jgi:hypothetical protein